MKMNEAFPSKYLNAKDFDEDQTLTIKEWSQEEFDGDNGKENKVILYFNETPKGFVLNKTNWASIEKVTGSDDTDDWVGRQITLYATEVPFGKDMVWSIRVRTPRPKSGGGAFSKPNGNGSHAKPSNAIDADHVLQAAKKEAWTIFGAKFAAVPDAERMNKLKEIVAATFPGQAPATLNAQQWHQLVRDDFEVPVDPFGNDVVNADDIPF